MPPNNITFDSSKSLDKIVGIFQGSFNVATDMQVIGGEFPAYPIPHTFGRPVFCEILVSLDGNNYIDGGSSGNGLLNGLAVSDANNIYILTTLLVSGLLYYKVICSWIDNYDTGTHFISPQLQTDQSIYFDTRTNYQQIFLQDVITGDGTVAPLMVAHNLGYPPNAKVFFESLPGQVWPQIAGGGADPWLYDFLTQYECYVTISNTQLFLYLSGPFGVTRSVRMWYRIYE